jgi:deoxyribonuclease IV
MAIDSTKIPRVGCHLSIAGGIARSVERATTAGCTAFQIFTRNPRGWGFEPIGDDDRAAFLAGTKSAGPYPVAHMPYLPNLAAPDPENFRRSVETLTSELERCEALGIEFLVTHLGSHLGTGEEEGRKRIVEAVRTAIETSDSRTSILLENTAGTKNSLGTTPDELARILDALHGAARVGVCIDTMHAFGAGYDWQSDENPFFDEVKAAKIGDRIRVVHLNDSKVVLGGRADRHQHLGVGEIGLDGLKKAVSHPLFSGKPFILETPVDDDGDDARNVAVAKFLLGVPGAVMPELKNVASKTGKPGPSGGKTKAAAKTAPTKTPVAAKKPKPKDRS